MSLGDRLAAKSMNRYETDTHCLATASTSSPTQWPRLGLPGVSTDAPRGRDATRASPRTRRCFRAFPAFVGAARTLSHTPWQRRPSHGIRASVLGKTIFQRATAACEEYAGNILGTCSETNVDHGLRGSVAVRTR